MPGRYLVLRDATFPPGACGANRSRTARSSPQGADAKGWQANARPKEHKWAVRQGVGGEGASEHEAQEPLAAFCRAQRRERTEQILTRGDPGAERRWGVTRGHSSDGGTHEQKGVPRRRAEGPNRANHGAGSGDERTNEAAGRDNGGRHPGLANDWPKAKGPPTGRSVRRHRSARLGRKTSGRTNRRMRKTARPVVWEGAGAQSPAPDPIRVLKEPQGTA